MIAVVHLVWGPLGVEPLRRFLDSYRAHPAGVDHDLVVLLNGVRSDQLPGLLAELQGVDHRHVSLPEPVQDLLAYRQAAALLHHDRVCFLNSHSVILDNDWLAKLAAPLSAEGVGVSGATGSWASMSSLALHQLGLPSAYRSRLPAGRRVLDLIEQIDTEAQRRAVSPEHGRRRTPLARARTATVVLSAVAEQSVRFPGFPCAHLRTNAFALERSLFTGLKVGRLSRKIDAYALESGRSSVTRQLQAAGLRPVVVGRDGSTYELAAWPGSETLWQREQGNLLVADNQTRMYEDGDDERRRMLAALAWGDRAEPATLDKGTASR